MFPKPPLGKIEQLEKDIKRQENRTDYLITKDYLQSNERGFARKEAIRFLKQSYMFKCGELAAIEFLEKEETDAAD